MSTFKKKLGFKLFLGICLVIFVLWGLISYYEWNNANELAQFAQEQFLNDEEYIQNLRDLSCLQDLEIEPKFYYSYENDYNAELSELHMTCELSFISDEIDNFYTTEYNGLNSRMLKIILNRLNESVYYENTTCTYENENGRVILTITKGPEKEFCVCTSSGREYLLTYYVGCDKVEIDGDWVYKDESGYDGSSKCSVCGGSGFVKYYYGGSDLEAALDGQDSFEYNQCYKCLGTGVE